jgi:hypothetical protein
MKKYSNWFTSFQSFYFQFNQYLAMRPHVWTPCGLCQISRMPIVLLSIQPIFSNGSHVWTARMDALWTLSDLRCAPPIQNDSNTVILKNIEKALKDSCNFFAHFWRFWAPPPLQHERKWATWQIHLSYSYWSTWHIRITSDHCGSLRITADHIRSPRITSDHIRSLRITADHCGSHQITADHIRSHQITSDHCGSHSIFLKPPFDVGGMGGGWHGWVPSS